jgi:hypothetical protein
MKSQDLEKLMSDFLPTNSTEPLITTINLPYNRFGTNSGHLRQYDKTYRLGPSVVPIIIYVELKLGEAQHSHFRLENEPRLTTPKDINELTHLRDLKQKELNKKYKSERNVIIAGIKCKPSIWVSDWSKYNLGSVMVPIVESKDDMQLKTAEIVSCHAQYDLKDEMSVSIDDFVGAREKVFLRNVQKEKEVFIEPKIINNLHIKDNEAHCYLLKNSKDNVLAVDIPLNPLLLRKKLTNLFEARNCLARYLDLGLL